MTIAKDLMKRLMDRFGGVIDLQESPDVLEEIVAEVASRLRSAGGTAAPSPTPQSAPPFGVPWMDSWVAQWVYADNIGRIAQRDRQLATVLQDLSELKFRERLDEIRRFVQDRAIHAQPPDGGPPEPGVPPPAGPSAFVPPDGGPPEPGGPSPAGPSAFEPPDGGPPEPGVPPVGPASSSGLADNPWILYWFVSLKAPLLLDVIDLHITRRLAALQR
jgi:hypothetical protein